MATERAERRGYGGGVDEHAAAGGSPGKRSMVEQRYGVQLRAAPSSAGPASAEPRAAAAGPADHDDPYGFHLPEVAGRGVAGAGGPLPHLEAIQRSFGSHDVSGVSAHVGGPAADACEDLGAQAYATGASCAFASAPDLHTAAHEAAHTVQQRAGVQLLGGLGRADDEHERHADAVADRVVDGQSAADLLDAYTPRASGAAAPVQLKWWGKGKRKDKDKHDDDQKADAPDPAAARKATIDLHEKRQAKVYEIIKTPPTKLDPSKGLSDPAMLLRNTCEWLELGLTKLYVLSDTHDATTRSGDGRIAHFDTRVAYPNPGGTYPEDPADMSGIGFHDKGDRGASEKGRIELYNVRVEGPSEDVTRMLVDSAKQTLVHEVQHQADGHADPTDPEKSPDPDAVKMVASEQLELYKSEFRAFWMQPVVGGADYGGASQAVGENRSFTYSGPNYGLSPKEAKATHAPGITRTVPAAEVKFVNQRQEDIFRELTGQKAYRQFGYFYATDAAFRDAVHAFTAPQSTNLVNSVRIHKLLTALEACKPGMKASDAAVTAALDLAKDVDDTDRAFLADRTLSGPFWDKAEEHLSAKALAKLTSAVAPSRH